MSEVSGLPGVVRRLRAACAPEHRDVLDLRRNVALWLSVRAGLLATQSSFYVELSEAPADAAEYDSSVALAALGYLLDLGGNPPREPGDLGRALDRVLARAPHTAEHTGYADDPLTLAGLWLMAKKLARKDVEARLRSVAVGLTKEVSITHAVPLAAATGILPRVTPLDEDSAPEIAAAVLARKIPEPGIGDLLPASVADAASSRLVAEVGLGRLVESEGYGTMLALAALEVIVVASAQPAKPETKRPETKQQRAADLVFLVALREEFRVFYELAGEPESNEVQGHTYYSFQIGGRRCRATLIGEMGPEAAVLSTERAIEHWNPGAVVLVGIAGGIHGDARLGDVVVASQLDLYLADTKSVDESVGFPLQHAGRVFQANHAQLQRVRNVEFTHRKEFETWMNDCRARLEQLADNLSELPEDGSRPRETPALLDGHIASGPTVAASAEFVKWIRARDRKCLAVEMEGGGAALASNNREVPIPVLVVRGISDHADASKAATDTVGDGVLRTYAMANAVQFVLGVLVKGGLL